MPICAIMISMHAPCDGHALTSKRDIGVMPQEAANRHDPSTRLRAADLSGGGSGIGWVVAAMLVAALFIGLYVLAGMTIGRDHSQAVVSVDRDAPMARVTAK